MRFALMIEPQQGLSYADQLASAKRAEAQRVRDVLPVRPLRELPGEAGQPTTDAWTVLAGLARETERIGLGVLVSPVTFRHPGDFAKVVTTVDEMSGGRIEVGVGAGWNDVEHRPARARLPADRGARRPARGPARDPARPVGRAGRLVVRRASPASGRATRSSGPAGRRPGRPTTPTGGAGRASSSGSGGVAAVVPARRPLRRRVQPQLVVARPRAEVRGKLDEACRGDRPRPVDARPLDDGRRADRPDEGEVAERERTLLAAFGRAETGEAWLDERRRALGLRHARPGSRPGRAVRRGRASSGSCSRTSSRGTST